MFVITLLASSGCEARRTMRHDDIPGVRFEMVCVVTVGLMFKFFF